MTQIGWAFDNAGFEPGRYDSKRDVIRPNSQIVALTLIYNEVMGMEYDYRTMYDILTAQIRAWALEGGRTTKRRRFFRDQFKQGKSATLHRYRMPKEFYAQWINSTMPLTWQPTTWVGSRNRTYLDAEVFEDTTGPVLVQLTAEELVPVIDGVARYPWDPNHAYGTGGSRVVTGFWWLQT
jgi:hypothetical protein